MGRNRGAGTGAYPEGPTKAGRESLKDARRKGAGRTSKGVQAASARSVSWERSRRRSSAARGLKEERRIRARTGAEGALGARRVRRKPMESSVASGRGCRDPSGPGPRDVGLHAAAAAATDDADGVAG